jgi:hypothetical protein
MKVPSSAMPFELGQAAQHGARVLAGRVVDAAEAFGQQLGEVARQLAVARGVPCLGALRIRFAPRLVTRVQVEALALLGLGPLGEVGADLVGDQEGRLAGPAHRILGAGRLLGTEGGAVGLALARHTRAAPADHGPRDDQARPAGLGARSGECLAQAVHVLTVDRALYVPAAGHEARAHVLAEADVGRAIDRDAVVVVEEDQIAEAQVSGQRGRLGADALHHVAVAHHAVDEVIARRLLGLTALAAELCARHASRQRHAHSVGEALAQRAGGDLDARRVSVLGMARRAGAPLPEVADLVQGQVVAV